MNVKGRRLPPVFQPVDRVELDLALPDLEFDMRAFVRFGASRESDLGALQNFLVLLDVDLGAVEVKRPETAAVVNDDGGSPGSQGLGDLDGTGFDGLDGGPHGHANAHAITADVCLVCPLLPSKAVRDRSVDWPVEVSKVGGADLS